MSVTVGRRILLLALAATLAGGLEAVEAESAPSVAERLAGAVRHETVSSAAPDDTDVAPFDGFREYLERIYPRVHERLDRWVFPGGSLLFRWQGRAPDAPARLLLAHQDVVPVEARSQAAWTHPPFAGVVADGFVWGRGAMDDKASLIAILEAVDGAIADGFVPERTLYLAFGADEEVGGFRGAGAIAEHLEARGVRLAVVLDEGKTVTRGVVRGVEAPVAEVGIAEKGYASFALRVEAPGGHSSRPPPESAVGIVSEAVVALERNPFPTRIDGATRGMLEALAGERSGWDRIQASHLWLFGGLVASRLGDDPNLSPYVRTTTATTLFHAGVRENVVPRHAEAVVNTRILPGDTIEGVAERIRRVIDDDRVTIHPHGRIRNEPSPVSATTGPAWRDLTGAVRATFPEAVIVPSLVTGYTDSRHFVGIADAVYRFAPNLLGPEDLSRFHGVDERTAIRELERGVEFYGRWIRAGSTESGGSG